MSTNEEFSLIAGHLRVLEEILGTEITFNDFSGVLQSDHQLWKCLGNMFIHRNPFCMMIKSRRFLWNHCLRRKPKIQKRAMEVGEVFCGMCYAGFQEWIIPVMVDGSCYGVLGLSFAGDSADASDERIASLVAEGSFSPEEGELLKGHLARIASQGGKALGEWSGEKVRMLFSPVTEAFQRLYRHRISERSDYRSNISGILDRKLYIVTHAQEFMRRHYGDVHLTIKTVAEYCHCSVSTLSHIFKGVSGASFREYLRRIRIEHGKELLQEGRSITEVAAMVGFNDSNYFSTVFRAITGVPPSKFLSPEP